MEIMKIAALDMGDRWTGIALSDAIRILARPYTTVATAKLYDTLHELLAKEKITTIVIGLPKTFRNTYSEQTNKVLEAAHQLKENFAHVEWVFWDERMTSQQASRVKKIITKQDKLNSHAIAAAIILNSYLEHLNFKKITS